MMGEFIAYDVIFRKIISRIFRILLLTNAIFILATNENAFPIYIYILHGLAYITIFFFLYGKEGNLFKLRLLNDFVFIGVILYSKNLNSIANTIFLFLPIINSPNHSGTKRSWLVYIFTLIVIFISDKNTFSYWHFLPLVILWILSWFENIRFSLNVLTNNLMGLIDKYDVTNYQFGNTHKIYRELIKEINASKLSHWFHIEKIVCFVIKDDDDLVLYNSSELVSTFSLDLSKEILLDLTNGKTVRNVNAEFNSISSEMNFCKLIQIISSRKDGNRNKSNYLFCLTLTKGKSFLFELFCGFFINYLTPLLIRISRLIAMETQLRLVRDNEILKIKNKLAYVNNTLLAMHFIRNKLTPIQNGIKMTLNQPSVSKSVDSEEWDRLRNKDLKISESALLEIRNKTNYILESEDNPFKIKELYNISFGKIFFGVRRIWLNYFSSKTLKVNVNGDTLHKVFFKLNDEAIEIVFTDIITNINKYSHDKETVMLEFEETNNNVFIKFSNNIKPKTNIEELQLIVDSFNTKEVSIINRKTHGLKILKEFLDQMEVSYQMQLSDNIFAIKLSFKKYSK